MLYFVGDWVKVRSNYDTSLVFDTDFYDKHYLHFPQLEVEILALHEELWYVVEVPNSVTEDVLILDEKKLEKWSLPPSRLHKPVAVLTEKAVGGRRPFNPYLNPLSCKCCQEFFPYAQPNQSDGGLVCWSCRQGWQYCMDS